MSKTPITNKQAKFMLGIGLATARRIVASENGKLGGKSSSDAKKAAARANLEKAWAARRKG